MKAPENSKLNLLDTRLILIDNSKGGVGKSLLTDVIARSLAKICEEENKNIKNESEKRRVLLIDGDGQANLTEAFRLATDLIPKERSSKRFFDEKDLVIDDITLYDIEPYLDFIPAHPQLFVEGEVAARKSYAGEYRYPAGQSVRIKLEKNLDLIRCYKWIIVDSNPYPGYINNSFFAVADTVLMPVESRNALTGILTTLAIWEDFKAYMRERMPKEERDASEYLEDTGYGIIYNRYQKNTVKSDILLNILRNGEMSERDRKLYGDFYEAFIEPPIPQRARLQNQDTETVSVIDDRTKETEEIRACIKQLINNMLKRRLL